LLLNIKNTETVDEVIEQGLEGTTITDVLHNSLCFAHIIGIHRGNYHSVIGKFIKQQTRNDSKALSARIWRKPWSMAHIHIEAA
jgi:hypothetical protein